jgi:hypothetical protein
MPRRKKVVNDDTVHSVEDSVASPDPVDVSVPVETRTIVTLVFTQLMSEANYPIAFVDTPTALNFIRTVLDQGFTMDRGDGEKVTYPPHTIARIYMKEPHA